MTKLKGVITQEARKTNMQSSDSNTQNLAIQLSTPRPTLAIPDYIMISTSNPCRSIRGTQAWDHWLNINKVMVDLANKFLWVDNVGFQLSATQRKLLGLALSLSQLSEPEGKVNENSLCRLRDKLKLSILRALRESKNTEEGPHTIMAYLTSFKLSVKAEIDRQKFGYACSFLKGLSLEQGPTSENGEIKSESELEHPLPTDVFEDLMEGRRDISRFPAFNALWPFSNLYKAEVGARNNPTKLISHQELPPDIKMRQQEGKNK